MWFLGKYELKNFSLRPNHFSIVKSRIVCLSLILKSISGQPPAVLRVKEQQAKKGGVGELSHPPFFL